jgi:hypothetical protein
LPQQAARDRDREDIDANFNEWEKNNLYLWEKGIALVAGMRNEK